MQCDYLSDAGRFSVLGQYCMSELVVDGQEKHGNGLCFYKNTKLWISNSPGL